MAGALVVEFAAATALIAGGTAADPARAASSPAPSSASMMVDGRTVRLVNLDEAGALLHRVRADIGAAVSAVEQFWGIDWGHGGTPDITIVGTDSDEQFVADAHLDRRRQWTDIAAVSVADDVDLTARRVSGQRIVFAPGAGKMSESALRIVLAHELFHLASRADTALDAPRWLTEGVADFVARPPAEIPAGIGTDLPSDAALETRGADRSMAYDRAWWFARFVADDYGVDGLRRLYVAACGPGHGDIAAAVREALGVDMIGLQIRWAQWLVAERQKR